MDIITPTTRTQVSSEEAYAEAKSRSGVMEISDSVAVTIAAGWSSPGHAGNILAMLAQGGSVSVTDLLDDIAKTRPEADTPNQNMALDMLATWAINHPSRRSIGDPS